MPQDGGEDGRFGELAFAVVGALSGAEARGFNVTAVDILTDGTIRLHLGRHADAGLSTAARPFDVGSPEESRPNVVPMPPADNSAPGSTRLRDIVDQYRRGPAFNSLAGSTRKEWGKWLNRIDDSLGETPLERFRQIETARPMIRRWRAQFARTPRSADYAMQVMSRVMSFAVDPLGVLDSNPCAGIKQLYKADRSNVVWTAEDIATLVARAPPEIGFAVSLGETTGLRLGDLLRLQWSAIKPEAIIVTTSKSRHRREAVIPRYDALNAALARIPRRADTILTNTRGRPWTKTGFGSSFNKAKQRAGFASRDLHFHDLRGTAATRFYTAGLSERVIGEILGWEETQVAKIIRRYVGRGAATQAAIQQLNSHCDDVEVTARLIRQAPVEP